jgi:hypothetical protein
MMMVGTMTRNGKMKITKRQLRSIIREQADSLSDRLAISAGIRDAIIDHLENEGFFEMGAIPQSVIKVIENSSLSVAEVVEVDAGDEESSSATSDMASKVWR